MNADDKNVADSEPTEQRSRPSGAAAAAVNGAGDGAVRSEPTEPGNPSEPDEVTDQTEDQTEEVPVPPPEPAQASGAADSGSEDLGSVAPVSAEEVRIRELEGALEQTRKEAQEAQARLRAVSKAYTDLQAEMKAFRERQESRAREDRERKAFELAKTFFDPVMNLKRSLQVDAASEPESFLNGLRLVHHQFMEALQKLGLEEVPGEGAPFDPNVHEALGIAPVTEEAQDGRVLTVHAAGYTVNGRVLQAAQVVVGKLTPEGGEA